MVGAHFQRATEEAAGLNMTGTKYREEKKKSVYFLMPSPTPAYTLPKTGPEMPERHHPAPSLAPGSSTTSHAS